MRHEAGLITELRGEVLHLTLDRPERRNALTVDVVRALGDALELAEREGVARVAVLTGSGPAFCAGGDLPSLAAVASKGARAATDAIYGNFHRLVRLLGSVSFPIVARIDGPAMGAGLDLALSCDLRVASTQARFASSWINAGLVPGMGGASLLTRAVGASRAAEAVLLGETLDARTAHAWGLINRLAEDEDLDAAVDATVGRLLNMSRQAVVSSKQALRRAASQGQDSELAALGAVQGALLASDEFAAFAATMNRSRQ